MYGVEKFGTGIMANTSARTEGPDRGWSWVVAAACFFSSLVLAGIFRTSGVLFVEFINSFGVSREEASWPMVLCISVLNLTGPFSGILGQKFGARPIIMTGAFIATIGISACFFTSSLRVITIFFGGIFGVGWGLMNTLMPGVLNTYFLNLRATANGIANSGSCFGSLILPVVFEYFISAYGLAGCFLLTGSIVLHIMIAGALMRPPSWLHDETIANSKHLVLLKSKHQTAIEQDSSRQDIQLSGNVLSTSINEFSFQQNVSPVAQNATHGTSASVNEVHDIRSSQQLLPQTKAVKNSDRFENEPIFKNKFTIYPKIGNSHRNNSKSLWTIYQSFITVLSSPMFYITAITNVGFYFLYHMYVVIIVDYALDRHVLIGNTKDMLFAFSIADLIGRLGFGWITDKNFVTRSTFMMICMMLIGVVFFIFPFSMNYWSLIAASSCYGLLLGCTMVIFPILLVDFLGIELHAVSYGCMCFMNGFASFGRPFLIGYFRDHIGSYSNMFYVLGSISIVGSLLWLLESVFAAKQKSHSVM